MTSVLVRPAFNRFGGNPRAGTTAVAAVTRWLTSTTKASPSRWTDPAKISFRVGPERGKRPHAETAVNTTQSAAKRALRDANDVTERLLITCTASVYFFATLPFFSLNTSLWLLDEAQVLPWCRSAGVQRVIRIFGRQHHVDHLAQQLPASARRIVAAGNLRCFQQIMAIVPVGAAVGAGGVLEKRLQGLIGYEFRLEINGLAEGLDRKPAPQRLLGGCRVDGDGRTRIVEQARQFAAAHVMD